MEKPKCKNCKHRGESHDEYDFCHECQNECWYDPHTCTFMDVNGFSRVKIDRGYR